MPLNNKEDDVLKLIITDSFSRDRSYYNYFFQKKDDLKWFYSLLENKIFEPNKTNIRMDENKRSQFWLVLLYLEKVSIKNDDKEIFKELLKIIESIIYYSKNENEINDYYNWWHIAKIFVNIPVDVMINHFRNSKYSFYETIFEITDHEASVALGIEEFGEKLLPKLFDANEMDLALDIIDLITTTEQADNTDSLGSSKAKFPTYDIEKIFNKNYSKIIATKNYKIIEFLVKRFNNSLMLNRFSSVEHFEFNGNYYEIKIARIQNDTNTIIEDKYLCSISEYDETECRQAKKDADENKNDLHFQIYLNQYKPKSIILQVDFSSSFDNLKRKVGEELLKVEKFKDLNINEEMRRAYRNLFQDFFNIKITDLDSDDDTMGSRDDASITLIKIIKEIFLLYIDKNDMIVEKYIEEFLSDNYIFPIFKKLAFYFIYKGESKYLNIFYKQIEKDGDILDEGYYELEVFKIIEELNSEFSDDFIQKLKISIEDKSNKVEDKYMDGFLFKWYSALRENENFKDKYIEVSKKMNRDESYTPFIGGVRTRHGTEGLVSPITGEQIIDMININIINLVEYLNNNNADQYSEYDQIWNNKPGKEGLAAVLSFVVKDNPKMFVDNLKKFKSVDLYYLKNILNGIELAIHDKKDIDYEKIMDFSINYFDDVEWKGNEDETYNHKNTTQRNIVSRIIDILKRGIEAKKVETSAENKKRIETIIEKILVFPYENKDYDIQDFISYTLNTILGKIIMLYVDFSLKYANANGKEANWGKSKYEILYNKGVDGKILYGYYLPQINFLDKDYVSVKTKTIPESDWLYFMSGYLSSSRLYSDIVNLMRDFYIQAVDFINFSNLVERKLIEHIALTYLYYNDSLENEMNDDGNPSLIFKLFNTYNERYADRLLLFSDYIGMRYDEDRKSGLIELWKYIFKNKDLIKEKMGDLYKKFPSRFIEISKLIDRIDEEFAEIMKWNIRFVESYQIHYFFKTLTKFETADQIHYICDILTDMLDMTVPTYDKDSITILVKRIYAIPELKGKADNICNSYGRQGIHFLRDIYKENNKEVIDGC